MHEDRHPKGLYVLFFTEMWERFGFYTMGGHVHPVLAQPRPGIRVDGRERHRPELYYLMFVYASPLAGAAGSPTGALGYRNSVLLGGLGLHGRLPAVHPSTPSRAVFAALTCLVIGNGSSSSRTSRRSVRPPLPGGEQAEGTRAYKHLLHGHQHRRTLLAPLVGEVHGCFKIGFRAAFAIAAVGMVASVRHLWTFKALRGRPHGAAVLPARRRGQFPWRQQSRHRGQAAAERHRAAPGRHRGETAAAHGRRGQAASHRGHSRPRPSQRDGGPFPRWPASRR